MIAPRVLALLPRGIKPTEGQPVAWAIKLPGGSALTFPAKGRISLTPWGSLDDAVDELDAYPVEVSEQDIERWEGGE